MVLGLRESKWLAAIEWALAAGAAAFQQFVADHAIWGDGDVRYNTLVQLVDHGTVSPARYSILQSLLAVPLYEVGKLFGQAREFVAYFNVEVFHVTLILLFITLRRHVPAPVLRRTILLLLAASMFGNHVQAFYGEVLTACAAMLGFAALATQRPVAAGIAMCVAVVNTPIAMLALLLCNGWWALQSRRWFHAAWPVVVSAMLIAAEFWWRRGSPFLSGYEGDSLGFTTALPYSGLPGFSYPLPLGVLSLLLSFGKGILFFAPGLLLCHVSTPDKRTPAVATVEQVSIMFSWGMLLAYASWWAWSGSVFWGPRFLLVACMPASFALARHVSNLEPRHAGLAVLTVSAVVWSVWVGVNGTVISEGYPAVCTAERVRYEALCWYVPEFSPLIHPLIAPKPVAMWGKVYMVLGLCTALVLVLPILMREARAVAGRLMARDGTAA